ncbi:MAG: branched-chain alpha-keto acid dehydrogenase subunit E2 [Candidatus Muproteobacteria bacterium RBG_16_64_11]|uniref:Dihydrolipoamide acetyltransferase component of pyruvate dehydrogenase complex n=1 Tax=Candidatus Muproteobacteria bacterium RBG_16_64_11 TaxID=1817758 RepID=A0A1F6TG09_9PROT|nr:MAG: branched-chain alpha-keto acid dehydrogenase subunit E2 [Candidatus Muproteobacteria bacterium RBG_16_64_11]
MREFKLPSLGADMDEGTLLEWHVQPGDVVKRGQVVAVVDTSKAAIEVECWEDGIVDQLVVNPGSTIPVGTVIALLRQPGETEAQAAQWKAKHPVAAPAPPLTEEPARRRVSPAARRQAEEKHIDIETVTGTGPQGAVTVEDVDRTVAAAAGAAVPDRAAEMRRTIAAAMARSKHEIPHYYLATEIPLAAATRWLAGVNESRPITERLLMAVLFIKATALALVKFPELNGFYRDGRFEPSPVVHVGVAISLRQGGLIAPALLDVNSKPPNQLMRELADLVKRARALSLKSSEFALPTVTVTNLGDQGVESVYGVIYPPQVALVGFGKITERAWVADGAVQIVPVVTASLSADHRASDGHRGGLFLNELKTLLQQPEGL